MHPAGDLDGAVGALAPARGPARRRSLEIFRRSTLTHAGMVRTTLYPSAAPTMARPMPCCPRSPRECLARAEMAASLGFPDHCEGDAVLHRASGIAALELARTETFGSAEPAEPDERRVCRCCENALTLPWKVNAGIIMDLPSVEKGILGERCVPHRMRGLLHRAVAVIAHPGHAGGKPAGVRCIHLTPDNQCGIYT